MSDDALANHTEVTIASLRGSSFVIPGSHYFFPSRSSRIDSSRLATKNNASNRKTLFNGANKSASLNHVATTPADLSRRNYAAVQRTAHAPPQTPEKGRPAAAPALRVREDR